jgi:hypothetical protein
MMPHFDSILDILESYDSAAEFGLVGDGLSWGENML